MEIKKFCDPVFKDMPCAVTVGVFDGLHRGHMKLIETLVSEAEKNDCRSVVIMFNANPKMLLGKQTSMDSIITEEETNKLLAEAGVDYRCIIDFSSDMSKLSGEEFIARLCTSYSLRVMVVGQNFRCGRTGSSAGSEEIRTFLDKYTSSAYLVVVPSLFVDGEEVSSSLIRRCLLTGDTEKASVLLGRPLIPGNGSCRLLKNIPSEV
ncbi:MAG: FAD synthetase family protein [Sphaerochaetaceae bacterium]|nr:FAD synthetase family protein [Sphaerochaetaceae bacterium]